MNMNWDGEIRYPTVFNVRDRNYEMDILKKAADAKPADPNIKQKIDEKIMQVIEPEQNAMGMEDKPELQTAMTHPPMASVDDMVKHMREMIEQGYTNEQIIELHPEMASFFKGDTNGEETQSS